MSCSGVLLEADVLFTGGREGGLCQGPMSTFYTFMLQLQFSQLAHNLSLRDFMLLTAEKGRQRYEKVI